MTSEVIQVQPPFHILAARAPCYQCGTLQKIVALTASSAPEPGGDEGHLEGPVIFTYVTQLPSALRERLEAVNPRYGKRSYYVNQCDCGTFYGDHYISDQPGGPFMPMYEGDIDGLTAERLPLDRPLTLTAQPNNVSPDLKALVEGQ